MATSSLEWTPIININNNIHLGLDIKSGNGKLFTDALTIAVYKVYDNKRYEIHLKKRELIWFRDMLQNNVIQADYPRSTENRLLAIHMMTFGGIALELTQPNRFDPARTRQQSIFLNGKERRDMLSCLQTAIKIICFDSTLMNGLSDSCMSTILYKAWNNKIAKQDYIPYEQNHFMGEFIRLRCKIDAMLDVTLTDLLHLEEEYSATLNMAIPPANKLLDYGVGVEATFASLIELLINFAV